MPRQKQPGAPEPKRRSRNGCWPCKSRKVKCGEEHPSCKNCLRNGDECDYRLRLNWEGRRVKRPSYDQDAELLPLTRTLSDDFGETVSFVSSEQPVSGEQHPAFETQTQQPVQYEFEHTLFQDFHQVSQLEASTSGTKKKPKSMDDSYALDRLDDDSPNPGDTLRRARRNLNWRPTSIQSPFMIGSPMTSSCASPALPPNLNAHGGALHSAELDFGMPNPLPSPRELQWSNSWVWDNSHDSEAIGSPQTSTITSCCSEEVLQGPSWLDEPLPDSAELQVCIINSAEGLVEYPVPVGNMHAACQDDNDTCSTQWPINMPCLCGAVLNQGSTACGMCDIEGALEKQNPFTGRDSTALSLGSPHATDTCENKVLVPGMLHEIEILPEKLRDRTNMQYFVRMLLEATIWDEYANLLHQDHFVNHTAKVLAPYHSPETNPFSTALPRMALQSEPLLSLLLAYSASHRAQVLRMAEPELRIAEWAEDIFPALRFRLSSDSATVPTDVLASIVLLTSLEKSSPEAFGHKIPWQTHLNLARSLMRKRIEASSVHDPNTDEDFAFVWSWFSYLDTMGQISHGRFDNDVASSEQPLNLTSRFNTDDAAEFDCGMGFTTRCCRLLARLAAIARYAEGSSSEVPCETSERWLNGQPIEHAAAELEKQLYDSMKQPLKFCRHIRSGNAGMRDLTEMDAASEAFHWAAIVFLRRRVLGKTASETEIQDAVQRIWECIQHIRREKEADTACVFPLFIAGCETVDEAQRKLILARFKSAEKSGMMQVRQARKLMEASWNEKKPWEVLIRGEFLG